MDEKDDYKPFPWEALRKRTVAIRPETERERALRLEIEAEASQIAADAPIVAALLGLDVKS